MIINEIILRLKERCPVFAGRVYGSAQLEEGVRQAELLPVPTAFVMFDGDFPKDNVDAASVAQEVEERWTIVVVVDNKDDKRGQWASNQLHNIRSQLLVALLGWENYDDEDSAADKAQPDDWSPITYRGGLHIDMNASRLWHQYSFAHDVIIAAPRYYETIPALAEIAIRGGPTGGDLTDEPFINPASQQVVQPPDVGNPPARPKHKNPNPEEDPLLFWPLEEEDK